MPGSRMLPGSLSRTRDDDPLRFGTVVNATGMVLLGWCRASLPQIPLSLASCHCPPRASHHRLTRDMILAKFTLPTGACSITVAGGQGNLVS
jgi:hypothetical protein